MTDLTSTIPQPEIERAVGQIISIAGYRRLTRDGAPWWQSGGKTPERKNGRGRSPEPTGRFLTQFLWALQGLNPRFPPCEIKQRALPPATSRNQSREIKPKAQPGRPCGYERVVAGEGGFGRQDCGNGTHSSVVLADHADGHQPAANDHLEIPSGE
jgi:hypothetical protein